MSVKKRQWVLGGLMFAAGLVLTGYSLESPFSGKALAFVASVALVGIGGSMVAALFATSFYSRQVFGLDLAEAAEALRGASPFSRANQVVELTILHDKGEVRVEAVHTFDLYARINVQGILPFSLSTDVGSVGNGGGFLSVRGSDGVILRGAELERYVTRRSSKVEFRRDYKFSNRHPCNFHIVTYGSYLPSGRLVWTVEQVSSDFTLRVIDRLPADVELEVRINHHRGSEVGCLFADRLDGRETTYLFPGEVLPFQGFEIMWSST